MRLSTGALYDKYFANISDFFARSNAVIIMNTNYPVSVAGFV